MEHVYLVRYGSMGQVGRFAADPGACFERGRRVVVRSHRGTELGEILIEATPLGADIGNEARVLRIAAANDLDRARQVETERNDRFESCERIFRNGVWPLDLIDVEPLLDDDRTVLHYLGPHRLDTAGILTALRSSCGLDVMLQPVGLDVEEDVESDEEPSHSCGDCGSNGGGCGTGGGCSDCGVKKLMASRL